MKTKINRIIERIQEMIDQEIDDEFSDELSNAILHLESAYDRLVAIEEEEIDGILGGE